MPTQEFSGEQLKLDGMFAAAAAAAGEWHDDARNTIRELAATGEPFTSEDVVAVVGLPRGNVATNRNNAVGAIMSAAARRGEIRKVGYRNAKRPALHAAALAVWVGNTTHTYGNDVDDPEPRR